jgi:hypothetical protein
VAAVTIVARTGLNSTAGAHALRFIDTAATDGVRAAIERRDGPWGDYRQAPPERRPDPSRVIEP